MKYRITVTDPDKMRNALTESQKELEKKAGSMAKIEWSQDGNVFLLKFVYPDLGIGGKLIDKLIGGEFEKQIKKVDPKAIFEKVKD